MSKRRLKMLNIKKAILALLTVLLIFGGVGCMRMTTDNNKIETLATQYLSDKYHQNFSVVDMSGKIDPELGTYVLLVCEDDVYHEKFYTYYSLDNSTVKFEPENDSESDLGEFLQNFDASGTFQDEYGEVVFGHKYADMINETLTDGAYAICEMQLTDYYPIKYDLDSSLDSGTGEWKEAACPKIYVFYENSLDVAALKDFIISNALSIQYVYMCKTDRVDKAELDSLYRENFDVFEDYIVENSKFSKIDFFYTTADGGLRNEQAIKG